eukprot:5120411-Amphidinium_carterae.1
MDFHPLHHTPRAETCRAAHARINARATFPENPIHHSMMWGPQQLASKCNRHRVFKTETARVINCQTTSLQNP